MSRTGALYANKRLLAKNCSSFMLTPAHVVFTTTQHLIKFVHITSVESKFLSFLAGYIQLLTPHRQTWRCPKTHRRPMSGAETSNEADAW